MNFNLNASAATFYGLAAVTNVVCWGLMSLVCPGSDFHARVHRYPLATRPSWMPARPFAVLRRAAHGLCVLVPCACAMAALWPDRSWARGLCALVMTLYCCAETSVTASHRDYANLYTSWALVLSPSDGIAAGVALGASVVLIAGSGWAKVAVGGARCWALDPKTLGAVLGTYHALPLAECGPTLPALNRTLRRRPWAVAALSTSTLVFECVLVPAALCMPAWWRSYLVWASVAMHAGIGVVQSFVIGVAFLPNVATYVFGFGIVTVAGGVGGSGHGMHVGSPGWLAAVGVVVTWAAATLALRWRRGGHGLLPEDWPVTPFALFAWNGAQWHRLFHRFVTGRRRIVVYNSGGSTTGLEGRSVVPHCWSYSEFAAGFAADVGISKGKSADVVYDGWDLLVGETFCHPEVLALLDMDDDGTRPDAWEQRDGGAAAKFVRGVSDWMGRARRFVNWRTGVVMDRVAYVELDGKTGKVARVLAA